MVKDGDEQKDGAVDPRRIRRKSNNERTFDQVKGFTDLERTEFKKKGEGVFYNKKQDRQKELEKRNAELETAPFDHDRKSRARSAPIPILKEKLVVNDLKTPEIKPKDTEKVVFAKSVRGKKNKQKLRFRRKEK